MVADITPGEVQLLDIISKRPHQLTYRGVQALIP